MLWETEDDFDLVEVGRLLTEEDGDSYGHGESDESYQDPKLDGNASFVMRKRRRSRTPFIPPVVKHDIRRFYGRMLTNVYNTLDVSLLKSFLETYSNVSNILFTMEVELGRRRQGAHYNPNFYYLEGLHEILNFSSVRNSFLCDGVSTIAKTSVKTRSDTDRSEVHFTSVSTMSLVYDFDIFSLHEDIFASVDAATCLGYAHVPNPSILSDKSGCFLEGDGVEGEVMKVFRPHRPVSDLRYPDPFEFYRMRHGKSIPFHDNPIEITLSFDMTISLNERRQIERIHSSKPNLLGVNPIACSPAS